MTDGQTTRPRVLLSTIHASDNYGSVLQAAALSRFLSEHADVEVLDHRPLMLNLGYYQDCLPYQVLRRRLNPDVAAFVRKHRALVRSQRALLPLGPRRRRTPRQDDYAGFDAVVVGSDEVWSGLWGDSRQFFLADAPDAIRRIAYAVSVGRSDRIGRSDDVRDWVHRFDHVLARDAKTEALCADLGRPADGIACDPVMLVDPSTIRSLAAPGAVPPRPYTLVYTEGCRADDRVDKGIASAGVPTPLVSVGFPFPGAVDRIDADVQEFVALAGGASAMVTSMFHGVVVGLTLGKTTVVLDRDNKRAKIDDLLRRVDASVVAEGEGFRVVDGAPGIEDLRQASAAALRASLEGL